MEGDGKTRWFEGNFTAYERAVVADDPDRLAHRRSKYKRLTLRERTRVGRMTIGQSGPLQAPLERVGGLVVQEAVEPGVLLEHELPGEDHVRLGNFWATSRQSCSSSSTASVPMARRRSTGIPNRRARSTYCPRDSSVCCCRSSTAPRPLKLPGIDDAHRDEHEVAGSGRDESDGVEHRVDSQAAVAADEDHRGGLGRGRGRPGSGSPVVGNSPSVSSRLSQLLADARGSSG